MANTTPKTQKKKSRKKVTTHAKLQSLSLRATRSIGSIESLFVHTVVFIMAFGSVLFGVSFDRVLLVVTTLLSLEAIYLAIFIQISVNQNTLQLREVERDIEEISEDIEEISEDLEEISEDIEGIEKDIEDIQEDMEEISEDIEEMTEAEEENANKLLADNSKK
jgi:methyl-accepting chemotaxis protein